MRRLTLSALEGMPEVERGAALAPLIVSAVIRAGEQLEPGDVVVLAQKIVSKSEGRRVRLDDVVPTARARHLASETGKDPRFVELVLRESREVVRAAHGVLIAEHRLGFIMANAGIDRSNVPGAEDGHVLLLPEDPDASAERIRNALARACGVEIGVIINDSFGRAWRNGVAGVAIGVAGVPALVDVRGTRDRQGRALDVTQIAAVDELAAAASLVMGQAGESVPAVLARGFPYPSRSGSVRELIRPRHEDLFR